MTPGHSGPDDQYCRSRVMTRRSPLAVSLGFAPRKHQTGLLALHALLSEIRSIPFSVRDIGVAGSKLAWWMQVITEAGPGRRSHPSLDLLHHCRPLTDAQRQGLGTYISLAAKLSVGEPIQDVPSFLQHARAVGETEAQLEVQLLDQPSAGLIPRPGVLAFVLRCLAEFGAELAGQCWWVPLDLRAKHELSLLSVRSDSNPGVLAAITELSRRALEAETPRVNTVSSENIRHLLVYEAMLRRRLQLLADKPARSATIMNNSWKDTFTAWRAARFAAGREIPDGCADSRFG